MGLRVRNSNYGSNGSDIGNRRWSSVMHIVTGMVWTHAGAPEMLIVAVKVMRPWAMPPIGIPMGAVIWSIWICLGAQGV